MDPSIKCHGTEFDNISGDYFASEPLNTAWTNRIRTKQRTHWHGDLLSGHKMCDKDQPPFVRSLNNMDKCQLKEIIWILVLCTFRITDCYPVRCVWRSSVSATLPETQTMTPLSECADGELYWNNPRGILTASFTQDGANKDFTLCLVVASGNETLAAVYDVSSDNPIRLDDVYSESNPACVDSVHEQVSIQFDATDTLENLAIIKYFKQPP